MLDKEKDVQGISLYVEFVKPEAKLQLLITPDGYTATGGKVSSSLYRRVTSTLAPKKQWRSSALSWTAIANLEGVELPISKKDEFAESRLDFAYTLFEGIRNGSWELVKTPVFIETSKKDLEDIQYGKTPNKLMYRIDKTREALGFDAAIAK
jgi:hypothetical protein